MLTPAELQELPMEAAACLPASCASPSFILTGWTDGTVFVAMADPLDSDNIRAVEQLLGRKVEVRLASEAAILKALDVWLGAEQADEAVEAADSGGSRPASRRLRQPTSSNCATWPRKRR